MGIGPTALRLYERQIIPYGHFRSGFTVCELGSQDFVPKEYNNWMARVPEKTARGLYQHLGASSYTCIDVNGEQGALRIDLNTSVWTGELFDVVTNHGTSEHVFNQFNCFRFMHDLTKLGGLMVHVVPGQGYYRHGFFNYGGLVFEALEKANNYGRICCYEEDDRQGSLMVVVFRKMADVRFVIPVQTTYGATVPECR